MSQRMTSLRVLLVALTLISAVGLPPALAQRGGFRGGFVGPNFHGFVGPRGAFIAPNRGFIGPGFNRGFVGPRAFVGPGFNRGFVGPRVFVAPGFVGAPWWGWAPSPWWWAPPPPPPWWGWAPPAPWWGWGPATVVGSIITCTNAYADRSGI